ncbi:hypothetical protein [Glycomyces terrestris]|uniref:Uncharacterized protein n=1 Tax=Glycomyces terrestris TaxID=2493553 RepID=A0A426UWB0_9ACTN|nr:hypothetical protein [Glycomyces terrestris]RRR98479.1 hypothetical protein EIW28_16485 [Glycomyces terrestris]
MAKPSMKIEFEVWVNAKGEIHLTSNDGRLAKGINIRAKEGLESTRVLREALAEQLPSGHGKHSKP